MLVFHSYTPESHETALYIYSTRPEYFEYFNTDEQLCFVFVNIHIRNSQMYEIYESINICMLIEVDMK